MKRIPAGGDRPSCEDQSGVAEAGGPIPSSFDHDVFVSYAHADDQVLMGDAEIFGWVTTLKTNLNRLPGQRKKSIFIDHALMPGDIFGEELKRKLERSRILLIVLSRNYAESAWCGQELEWFIRHHGDDAGQPRNVFVAELAPNPRLKEAGRRLVELRNRILFAAFWRQRPDQPNPTIVGIPTPSRDSGDLYWQSLGALATAIDARLDQFDEIPDQFDEVAKTLPHAGGTLPGPSPIETAPIPRLARPTIFLADVPADLAGQRRILKKRLREKPYECDVVPAADYLGVDADRLPAQIDADIARSALCVQLLSPAFGDVPDDLVTPLPQLQHTAILRSGKPFLQWSESRPGSKAIADPGHSALFTGASLIVRNFESFADEMLSRLPELLNPPVPRSAHQPGPRRILLDDLGGSPDLRKRVQAVLRRERCELRRAPENLRANEKELIDALRWSRTVLIIYDNPKDRNTVSSRLRFYVSRAAAAEIDVTQWGFYLGPMPNRIDPDEEFELSLNGMVTLDGTAAFNERALSDFARGGVSP
ncbi:MAG: toll/interleukin-1 receptor domain-containing protein [Alphaproteobacteria bacterium]|nr:toll/interleukin-1 receptor domain-containing protein [Alphaproteobacteria bacterium]